MHVLFQRSLEQHSVETLVISFGCQEGASHWLRETGCPYDMLLDPDRKVRRQHSNVLTRDVCLFLNKALYLYLLNAAAVHSVGSGSVCEEGAELQEHATVR